MRFFKKKTDNLVSLLQWYAQQCDGDWEHCYGVKIETLDNPGWSLKISLNETELEDKHFESIFIERSEHDWVHCSVKEKMFKGYGGPFNLPEILQIFCSWRQKE